MGIVAPKDAETEGRRVALVICNGIYADSAFPQLAGVNVDFREAQRVFGGKEAAFEVTAQFNAGFVELRKAIAKTCASVGPPDTLLIYYSGFSFRGRDHRLYLPASDSDKEYPEATALDTDFILANIRESRCARTVILVDGCHAGAFFEGNRGIPNGLFFIGACGPLQMTRDTPDGGVFTQALLAGIESPETDTDGDGKISVDELHEFVKRRLAKDKHGSSPYKWSCGVDHPIYLAQTAPRVFLSYCRDDTELAGRLKDGLERRNLWVWFDREGITSGNWKARVTQALRRSRAVVFLMSKASLASDSVQRELEFATKRGVPVIPIVMGSLDFEIPDWFSFDYGSIHRHEATSDCSDADLDALAQAIRDTRPTADH